MSLLTAVTNVAAEAGYSVDTTVIGSSDVTTKQLLAIANRVNKEMAIAYPWSKFFASGSITLVSGTASYALPASFSYQQYESFWNQSTRWRVLGPMTEQEYAEVLGYGLNTTVYQRYQIRGVTNSTLLISPTPGTQNDGEVIIFEYISARSIRPKTWTASTAVTSGQYIFYNGNYYTSTGAGTTGSTAPTWTTGTQSDGGVSWTYYSGAYEDFVSDSDETILSQRVLEQGMLERFAQIHGLEGVVPRYNDQLNEEFSKDTVGKILWVGGENANVLFARSGKAIFGTWI